MAIYRSDQAQLTFAVEAAPGGSPELASTVTDTTVGVPGALTHVPPASGTSGVNTGTHVYKVTWVIDGVETGGGVTSAVLTIPDANNQNVTLGNIPVSSSSGTITKNVYRTKANTSNPFYLVNSTGIANGTAGYADTRTDAQLTTIIPATGLLNGDAAAGSRSITVDTFLTGAFVVGNFIRIGPMWGSSLPLTQESEIRRIEFLDGTTGLHLDSPTAFFHPDNTNVTFQVVQPSRLMEFLKSLAKIKFNADFLPLHT